MNGEKPHSSKFDYIIANCPKESRVMVHTVRTNASIITNCYRCHHIRVALLPHDMAPIAGGLPDLAPLAVEVVADKRGLMEFKSYIESQRLMNVRSLINTKLFSFAHIVQPFQTTMLFL